MSIAINRFGNINTKGLPVCELNDIQPATTADALAVCRKSLVGEGSFTADVPSSGRAPFPSEGKLYAFNGVSEGRPAILAHVYGVRPAPTSFTLVFLISKSGGTYGNTLKVALPSSKAGGSDHGNLAGAEQDLQVAREDTVLCDGLLPSAEGRQGRRLPLRESLPRVLGRAQGQLDAEPQLLRAGQVTPAAEQRL